MRELARADNLPPAATSPVAWARSACNPPARSPCAHGGGVKLAIAYHSRVRARTVRSRRPGLPPHGERHRRHSGGPPPPRPPRRGRPLFPPFLSRGPCFPRVGRAPATRLLSAL